MINDAIKIMTTLNRTASEVSRQVGVNACTDITGYGLLGHLLEMCKGSKVSANIQFNKIEFIDGAVGCASNGIIPGGTKRNLSFIKNSIIFSDELNEIEQHLLADAQTSGGLLISVSNEKASELESKLTENGCFAMNIGTIDNFKDENYIQVS